MILEDGTCVHVSECPAFKGPITYWFSSFYVPSQPVVGQRTCFTHARLLPIPDGVYQQMALATPLLIASASATQPRLSLLAWPHKRKLYKCITFWLCAILCSMPCIFLRLACIVQIYRSVHLVDIINHLRAACAYPCPDHHPTLQIQVQPNRIRLSPLKHEFSDSRLPLTSKNRQDISAMVLRLPHEEGSLHPVWHTFSGKHSAGRHRVCSNVCHNFPAGAGSEAQYTSFQSLCGISR